MTQQSRQVELEGGKLTVIYSRTWSRAGAWQHLQDCPPAEVAEAVEQLRKLDPEGKILNPWRARHNGNVWRWSCEPDLIKIEHQNAEDIRHFDPEVWRSISARYRMVSRLPEGLTGMQALQKHAPEAYRRILVRAEQDAQAEWHRIYSDRVEGCHQTLTHQEWSVFKKAGGQSA